MSSIHIQFDETDISKILNKVITGDNKEEMVKLLLPIIYEDSNIVELLTKLYIGHSLPKLIPAGSFCRVSYDDIGYVSQSKEQLFRDNCDENNMLIGIVGEFRGYHRDMYKVTFKLKDAQDETTEEYCFVRTSFIEVIKEF